MAADALSYTEARSLHFAQEYGKALGGLQVIAEFLNSAQEYPEIRDDILSRARQYANNLIAEFGCDG